MAAENAPGWRNVRVVSPDRRSYMSFIGNQIVSWVKSNPSQSWYKCFNPGVCRVLYRSVVVFFPMVEIPTDIAAGDADVPCQGNHNVCEVLAHSFAARQSIVDRRIDMRALLHVSESLVECRIQLMQDH